jgi:hypothetical protein
VKNHSSPNYRQKSVRRSLSEPPTASAKATVGLEIPDSNLMAKPDGAVSERLIPLAQLLARNAARKWYLESLTASETTTEG